MHSIPLPWRLRAHQPLFLTCLLLFIAPSLRAQNQLFESAFVKFHLSTSNNWGLYNQSDNRNAGFVWGPEYTSLAYTKMAQATNLSLIHI